MFQVLKKLMRDEFFSTFRVFIVFPRSLKLAVSRYHGNECCLSVNKALCLVQNGSEVEGKHSICFPEGLGPSEYSLCVLHRVPSHSICFLHVFMSKLSLRFNSREFFLLFSF